MLPRMNAASSLHSFPHAGPPLPHRAPATTLAWRKSKGGTIQASKEPTKPALDANELQKALVAAANGSTPPDLITIARQDQVDYKYPSLLRFRWYQSRLGVNLHRGPVYSGLGGAWLAGYEGSRPANDLLTPIEQQALIQKLEGYASTCQPSQTKNNVKEVRLMADNANCK